MVIGWGQSGGQRQDHLVLLASGAQAPTRFEIYSARVIRTPPTLAKLWQLVYPITAVPNRKGCTRRCTLEARCCQILMAKGPCGLSGEGKQILILPAGNYEQTKVARPRNRGSRGTPPMSTAAGKVLIEGVPLAHLWLLSVRAESNTVSPNRRYTLVCTQ